MRCLVILPTYNERGNIEPIISELLALTARVDVLVVDDASPDGTAAFIKERWQGEPRVSVLERSGKLGLGTAYVAGFEDAMIRNYDAACTMDADGSHDPAHLPAMLVCLADADLVIGSRYCRGGAVERWSIARKINSFVANALGRAMTGMAVADMTSGFRVYRIDLLKRMPLAQLHSRGYSTLVELLFMAHTHGARICESPILFKNRKSGESKISSREILESLKTLARIRRRNREESRACRQATTD